MHDVRKNHEFVHLASGTQAAEVVRATLRQLGRDETVFATADSFAEGPLTDVDAGAASRLEWYSRINPELVPDAVPGDDSELWERVDASSADVMLWHGPHPVERIFAMRACHHGWIYSIGVAPALRRQGYARALLTHAETQLRALGCPKINIQVLSANESAMRFWRSAGYELDLVVSLGRRL